MAVRRALNEKELRLELQEARMALRHSQSLYRALVDNPAYGICRCSGDGQLVDFNQALVAMLGYANREDLLAANYMPEVISALGKGSTRPRHVQGADKSNRSKSNGSAKTGRFLRPGSVAAASMTNARILWGTNSSLLISRNKDCLRSNYATRRRGIR
jgi:PAS domain S-box-containing protein